MASPSLAPGLARKVKKVLDIRPGDASGVTGCLAPLSNILDDTAEDSRRGLRGALERGAVRLAEQHLKALDATLVAAVAVHADATDTATRAARAASAAAHAAASVRDAAAGAATLRERASFAKSRADSARAFLTKYALTADESETLRGGEVGPAFFAALKRASDAHARCAALLRASSHRRAGIELMEATSADAETGYSRLARDARARAAELGAADAADAPPELRAALTALRIRPALRSLCIEELVSARRDVLFARWIDALTRGPRPLELSASDPRRFSADILAWSHAALAGEREFFSALLLPRSGPNASEDSSETSGPRLQDAGLADESGIFVGGATSLTDNTVGISGEAPSPIAPADEVMTCVDAAFEGVCRPLRARLEQVVQGSPPAATCLWLARLLAFYADTAASLAGLGGEATAALRGLRASALRALSERARQRADKARRFPPPPPSDRGVPPALRAGADELRDVLACAAAAPRSSGCSASGVPDATAEADADTDAALNAVLDPLLEAAERGAEVLDPHASARVDDGAHLAPGDRAVYLLNCLDAFASPLEGHEAGERALRGLRARATALEASLADDSIGRVLAKTGLGEVAARVTLTRGAGDPGVTRPALSSDPSLDQASVAGALRTFIERVSDPSALPEFAALRVPAARDAVTSAALRGLADAYTSVYDAIFDEREGYDVAALAVAVRHTPAHVRVLLGST